MNVDKSAYNRSFCEIPALKMTKPWTRAKSGLGN